MTNSSTVYRSLSIVNGSILNITYPQDMGETAFPWLDSDPDKNQKIFDILMKCWTEEAAYSNAADNVEPLKSCVYAL